MEHRGWQLEDVAGIRQADPMVWRGGRTAAAAAGFGALVTMPSGKGGQEKQSNLVLLV